ncbi:hypothetical protein GE061_016692 [Apolygus lucorum]|uniref:Cyclase n=1 Tax=Apolygus lucorum TaxID=248454 RepID=A0A8S9XGS4_APOLU|nr:hypothetical protein GE061_016692 [Apolygus lucorum]
MFYSVRTVIIARPADEMKPSILLVVLAEVWCLTLGALPSGPIDLGYGYDEKTIEYPGGEKFNYRKMWAGNNPAGVFYAANDFATAEHCGTHLDAPYHFNKNGRKVGDIPLDRLITKAILVDAVKETGNNDSYVLPAAKLDEWVKINGEIPDKSVILVKFGWSTRYPNRQEYLGPSDTDLRFPGLTEEAAKWIVDSKKFVGLGVDSASFDDPRNEEYPVHKLVLGNDLYGLENVNLNFDLPPVFDIIVMPIKLVNGTGGPARIIAL